MTNGASPRAATAATAPATSTGMMLWPWARVRIKAARRALPRATRPKKCVYIAAIPKATIPTSQRRRVAAGLAAYPTRQAKRPAECSMKSE